MFSQYVHIPAPEPQPRFMSNRVSSTTKKAPRLASSNAGSAEVQGQAPEGSTVYFMPNLSNPRPPNWETLPILLLDYQVPQNGIQKHNSFGFIATAFQTVQMNLDLSSTSLPAIVWQGKESVLCLVFPTEAARTKCIRRVGKDKPFGLNLERDLQASFLVRDWRTSSPSDGVELFQVCGTKYTIMSRRVGQRGFVTVDPTWSKPPHFIPFDWIAKLGSSGNWAFVLMGDEAKRTCVCIIECDSPSIARDVVWSLRGRAQRQISVSDAILSVTIKDIGEQEFALTSHSEELQPNRVPFTTAWARFVKSIRIPDYFGGQGQHLGTQGGAA